MSLSFIRMCTYLLFVIIIIIIIVTTDALLIETTLLMNYVNLWLICNHYLTAFDPHTHTLIGNYANEYKKQHQMKKTEKIKIKTIKKIQNRKIRQTQ